MGEFESEIFGKSQNFLANYAEDLRLLVWGNCAIEKCPGSISEDPNNGMTKEGLLPNRFGKDSKLSVCKTTDDCGRQRSTTNLAASKSKENFRSKIHSERNSDYFQTLFQSK